jgi:hypothetical protein
MIPATLCVLLALAVLLAHLANVRRRNTFQAYVIRIRNARRRGTVLMSERCNERADEIAAELAATQRTLLEIQKALPTPERLREIARMLPAPDDMLYGDPLKAASEIRALANKLQAAKPRG